MVTPRFNSLVPILYVADLEAEKRFYVKLGFRLSFEGDDLPGFIGVAFGKEDERGVYDVEFGLEQKEGFDPRLLRKQFVWQMGVDDLDVALARLEREHISLTHQPEPGYYENIWTATVTTPSGYELVLEGPRPSRKKNT